MQFPSQESVPCFHHDFSILKCYLWFVIILKSDEENTVLPCFLIQEIFPEPICPNITIQHIYCSIRVQLFESKRVLQRLRTAHPTTIRMIIVSRTNTLNHHDFLEILQIRFLFKQVFFKLCLRENIITFVILIFNWFIGKPTGRNDNDTMLNRRW